MFFPCFGVVTSERGLSEPPRRVLKNLTGSIGTLVVATPLTDACGTTTLLDAVRRHMAIHSARLGA